MRFKASVASEKGPREEQQDSAQFFEQGGSLLALVCDGAGGHRGGSDASKVAVETARGVFEETNGFFDDPKKILEQICVEADQRIRKLGESPKFSPKSAIAMIYINKKNAYWVHVGDSRVYRIRAGRIEERTRDHSMVQILFEQGEVSEDEMGNHPDQGRLLRALGSGEDLKVSHGVFSILDGDAFLLCSDGFWERIKSHEIEEFFKRKPTEEKLQAMVKEAVRRNGPNGDNTTAVVVVGGDSGQWRLFDILLIICALLTGTIAAFVFFPFVRDVIGIPKFLLDFFGAQGL
jgi:serine/threonine protein phosphatase PrpC